MKLAATDVTQPRPWRRSAAPEIAQHTVADEGTLLSAWAGGIASLARGTRKLGVIGLRCTVRGHVLNEAWVAFIGILAALLDTDCAVLVRGALAFLDGEHARASTLGSSGTP